ncbi:MAG TPA: hypothetical protein IAC44_02375 [Candidatus Merdimorpha stercoravium]|uniref:Uncharacterized protein n=1 Tax=Candidatus Merdimorpha stercoravium TaxID=2840863 RepID=A0A9D1H8L9_9FLAO|nr:hypothetical protein [Candidatus Merdimorpha stercoravium]
MEQQTNIPEAIYDDELVCFLAERYRTTPRKILQRFLEQSRHAEGKHNGTFLLEENEMSILRDMMDGKHS